MTMRNSKIRLYSVPGKILLVLAIGGFMFSCEKESTDPPHITNIRMVDPEMADVPIEGAGLENWVVIQGTGFSTTQEIYFNEYQAIFNPVLVSENNIVIQIPAGTPNIGTDSLAPNTVRVVTQYGEDTYSNFIVFAPPAEISTMTNEFALPGDTIVLSGRYFYAVDSVIFPGGYPGEVLSTSDDGEECTVVVPDGASNPGPIRVVTPGGTGESGYFRDTVSVMINDFDGLNFLDWGRLPVTPSEATLPVISGNYFGAAAEDVGTGNWWVDPTAMPLAIGSLPDEIEGGSLATNLYLKFEVNITGIWNSGFYKLEFAETDAEGTWLQQYTYLLQEWGTSATDRTDFNTKGKWITYKIPLSEWTNNNLPMETWSDMENYNRIQWVFVNPWAPPESIDIEYIYFAFDNIRILYEESE